jgi:hypothetical protein
MNCSSCRTPLPEDSHFNRRYCSDSCRYREDSRRKAGVKRVRRVREQRPDPVLPPADLGWLAGIIDGEGSIALISNGGRGNPNLRVSICNGSDAILDKIGDIYKTAGISSYGNRELRGTTQVTVGTAGALLLHRLIRPYLVRQVEQYDAAVSFLAGRYSGGRLRVFWTDEDRAEWDRLRRKFHSKRGVFA